jgi:UDP-3-O-[3-hydroxymyristoyl] glucosamine N-acyltransferase
LSELAEIVGGELHGPPELLIARPVPAGSDDPFGITFAESSKYMNLVNASGVGAVIVSESEEGCTRPHIKHRSPREAFGRILALCVRELPLNLGVHGSAVVSRNTEIDSSASIGAFCVIEDNVSIGPDVKIYPFCYIGQGCVLNANVKLYPHVTLYRDVEIGERTIVHAGAVLGADGFGYFWDGVKHRKIPQVGGVKIGEDCEIGALTAIDRATAGSTEIGDGSKIDNLVQIAHNVKIGDYTVIASQTGLSGSSKVGKRVTIAGQCGLSDHVEVADEVVLGGKTGVTKDIDNPGEYWGTPAKPIRDQIRMMLLSAKLPDIIARLERIEKTLESLRSK